MQGPRTDGRMAHSVRHDSRNTALGKAHPYIPLSLSLSHPLPSLISRCRSGWEALQMAGSINLSRSTVVGDLFHNVITQPRGATVPMKWPKPQQSQEKKLQGD